MKTYCKAIAAPFLALGILIAQGCDDKQLSTMGGGELDDLISVTDDGSDVRDGITDRLFLKYVDNLELDLNKDGRVSPPEAARVVNIVVMEKGIVSLEGIKSFVNLGILTCDGNNIAALDVSGMTKLRALSCSESPLLTSLNVSGCENLETLNLSYSAVGSIDLSQTPKLKSIEARGEYKDLQPLEALDLSACPAVEKIDAQYSNLSSLNITGCAALENVSLRHTKITALDLSKRKDLRVLSIPECYDLTTVNMSECDMLEKVDCDYTPVKTIDISNAKYLRQLDFTGSGITSIEVKDKPILEYISGEESRSLTGLTVSGCPRVTTISVRGTALETLDTNNCPNLESLTCGGHSQFNSPLQTLDISGCPKLESLACAYSDLEELDISNNKKLETISCNHNEKLETIYVWWDPDKVETPYWMPTDSEDLLVMKDRIIQN